MPVPEIDIELINDSDIQAVNVFYNSVYHSSRDAQKFDWEFRQSPARPGIFVVAKDRANGKIVGSQAAIPIYITHSGRSILTAKSEDTLVDPAYRGLNIFEKMYALLFSECAKAGIHYIWGFTFAKKPFTKLGFECPFEVSESVMVFESLAAFRYLVDYNKTKSIGARMKMLTLALAARVMSLKLKFAGASADTRFSINDRLSLGDNKGLIEDMLSISPEYFIVAQNAEYLSWRIGSNPYHDEIFSVTASRQGQTVANLLFNHHARGCWYVIQDLYASSLTPKEKSSILANAIVLLRQQAKNRPALIRSWEFQHNETARANLSNRKRVGFIHIPHGSVFVWKVLDGSPGIKAENFHLSRINSEGKI